MPSKSKLKVGSFRKAHPAAPGELEELLGFNLDEQRKRYGLSVARLAELADVSERQAWHWLQGNFLPTGRSVLRLRRFFVSHGILESNDGS